MALRKTHSMKAFILSLLLLSLTITTVHASNKNAASVVLAQDKPFCPENFNRAVVSPILQNLESINLHVNILTSAYAEAIKCHGRESECRPAAGVGLQRLKDTYNYYPKAMLPENLTALSVKALKNSLAPLFGEKNQCTPPEINVISGAYRFCPDCGEKTLHTYANEPNSLIVKVSVAIFNDVTNEESSYPDKVQAYFRHPYGGKKDGEDQRIALFKWQIFRQNCAPSFLYPDSTSQEYVIPLSWGEERIEKFVTWWVGATGGNLQALQTWPSSYETTSCVQPLAKNR